MQKMVLKMSIVSKIYTVLKIDIVFGQIFSSSQKSIKK